jgi:hypothetical protein
MVPSILLAQRSRQRWKANRSELQFGIGVSNFLGELGGANQVGTDFVKDLELSETNLAIEVGWRYKLNQRMALNSHLTYGQVSGDDKLTDEFFRSYRNLNFKSNIWELGTNFEFAFVREQPGHRYRLKGVRGKRGFEIAVYGFVGVTAFHMNPKGELNGDWHELQPLGTEGQGVSGSGKSKYKRLQLAIPLGIGFKYNFDRQWGIQLQYGIRKTFTDYIDDVSTEYYSRAEILQSNGLLAAQMADKSSGEFEYITEPGAQRGDSSDKDSYMFAIVSVVYKFSTGRRAYPLF